MFSRSNPGMTTEYLFHEHPLIWVEGKNDVNFYRQFLNNLNVIIKPAGGLPNCEILASEVIKNDKPFVVVMDGHYDILVRTRNPHRRVIYLRRHSSENYLFEREIIENICRNYLHIGLARGFICRQFDTYVKKIQKALQKLTILDITHQRKNSSTKIMKDDIKALLDDDTKLEFSNVKINKAHIRHKVSAKDPDYEKVIRISR